MSTPIGYPQLTLADLPRRTLVASLLLTFVLLAHAALMTTEQHAAVMDTTHALHAGVATAAQMIGIAHRADSEIGEEQVPTTILDACPAQQAILPLLLLVVLLLFASGQLGQGGASLRQRQPVAAPLLPLTLQRRLAFLQVFLI